MNLIADWMGQPWMQAVGRVLLHSLWQGALIAGLFEATRFMLRRSSAQARYNLGCLALTLMLAAPLLTLVRILPDPSRASSSFNTVDSGSSAAAPSFGVSASPAGVTVLVNNPTNAFDLVTPWLAVIWLSGVVIFAGRLTRSWWWVGTLRTREVECVPETLLETLDVLKRRLEVSRPVRLLKSALVEAPTVVGWLKPVILLPAATLAGLTPRQLEAILAHELAHVRRFDYLVNTFQCVVETLLFYHPATWWISRCIREEREHCCDDMVVRVFGDRLGYARALAAVEEARAAVPRMAFAATGGSLFNRIRRLAGLSPDGGPATTSQVGGLVLLAVGIVLVAWGVVIYCTPRVYSSSVQLRILAGEVPLPRSPSLSMWRPRDGFEIMLVDPVLERLMKDLHLAAAWKLEDREAMERLRNNIQLELEADSAFVTARVTARSPEEAARIANALPSSYRNYREENEMTLRLEGTKALEEQHEEHDRKVRGAQAEVDRLRQELAITDADPASIAPQPSLSPETLRTLTTQQLELRGLEVHQETQLEGLLKLDRADLRHTIQTALDQPHAGLIVLLNDLAQAERELLKLKRDVNDEHPSIVAARETLAALNEQIDRAIEGILAGLGTRLSATRAQIEEIGAALDETKARDRLMAERTRPYYIAKQKLAELQHFRTAIGLKILAQQTEHMLPRASIEVIRVAVAAPRPVAPNRTLAGVLTGSGVLSGLAGLALLRTPRRGAAG